MSFNLEMIKSGASVRKICEGAFSDVHIELSELLESIYQKYSGLDVPISLFLNKSSELHKDLQELIDSFAKYSVDVETFILTSINENPGMSITSLLLLIDEKFL